MKRLVRHHLEDVEMCLCSEHHGQKKTFFKITQFTKAAYNFYLSRPPHIFPFVTIKTAIKGQRVDVIVLRFSPHVPISQQSCIAHGTNFLVHTTIARDPGKNASVRPRRGFNATTLSTWPRISSCGLRMAPTIVNQNTYSVINSQ